jgi:predicted transcriptional regulator
MPDIKQVRRDLGLTQVELAGLLDLDQSTISRLERGELPVDKRTGMAIELLMVRHASAGESDSEAEPEKAHAA